MLERNKIFRRLIHRKTLACSNKFCNYPNPDLLIESTTTVGLATQAHKDQLLCCYTASANLKSTSTLKVQDEWDLYLVGNHLADHTLFYWMANKHIFRRILWILRSFGYFDRSG
ncbi:uncharacterized protein PHA67_008847 isoform 2-T2 [Liasis olivaceus]